MQITLTHKIELRPNVAQRKALESIARDVRRLHNFVRAEQQRIGDLVWREAYEAHPDGDDEAIKADMAARGVWWTWTGSYKGTKEYKPIARNLCSSKGPLPSWAKVQDAMAARLEELGDGATDRDRAQLRPFELAPGAKLALPQHLRWITAYRPWVDSAKTIEKAWFRFKRFRDPICLTIQDQSCKALLRERPRHVAVPGMVKSPALATDISNCEVSHAMLARRAMA